MIGEKVNSLTIRTPEGCTFSLLLAAPSTRFLAWLIDMICVIAATMLVAKLLTLLRIVDPDMASALFFLVLFAIWVGYGIIQEWFWKGRTIGKRVLRLRVIDQMGLHLTFGQIVIRNLLRFADMLPSLYMVGGLSCLLTRRAQRLGDLVANTVVVRTPKVVRPDPAKILSDKFNSFRAHPHLEARLRQRVSPQEAHVALKAISRRDVLEPAGRVELFGEIAGHFRSVVKFPEAATEGLSDEQYVRNVLDTLFRPQVPRDLAASSPTRNA